MFRVVIFVLLLTSFPRFVAAVLPPDIIFSVGTQLWQLIAGVGALLVGSITALFPFMKTWTMQLPKKRVIVLSSGITIALFALAYLLYLATDIPEVTPPRTESVSTSTGFEFHSNRFVFVGTKKNKERVLVNMDLNRKELPSGGYVHYYIGGIVNGNTHATFYEEKNDISRDVLPQLFFSEFSRTVASDHSARESYDLRFSKDAHDYHIATALITSDFLVKNEPEYTAYIGVGTATGTIDGEEVSFRAMIERVYSTDYRPTIFFDPEDKLPSETIQLVLWDDGGNFYLVDRSKVGAYSPAYSSHFWGLIKYVNAMTTRVFGNDAQVLRENGITSFRADLSGDAVAHTIDLRLARPFEDGREEGYVEGVVSSGGSTAPIFGYGYHHFYGPQ